MYEDRPGRVELRPEGPRPAELGIRDRVAAADPPPDVAGPRRTAVPVLEEPGGRVRACDDEPDPEPAEPALLELLDPPVRRRACDDATLLIPPAAEPTRPRSRSRFEDPCDPTDGGLLDVGRLALVREEPPADGGGVRRVAVPVCVDPVDRVRVLACVTLACGAGAAEVNVSTSTASRPDASAAAKTGAASASETRAQKARRVDRAMSDLPEVRSGELLPISAATTLPLYLAPFAA
jgi:hypothetical protein